MKIIDIVQGTDEWQEFRKGKCMGSKVGDILSKRETKGRKVGFYQLIADKVAIEDEDIDGMDRGHRLEDEALSLYEETEGKKYRRGLVCVSDEDPDMGISPDGLSDDETEAVEVKCLSTRIYLKAYFEKTIPDEYEFQKLQYFIVNPKLEQLHFVFYDPRVTAKPLFWITVFREDVADEVEVYKQKELEVLKEVNRLVAELTF